MSHLSCLQVKVQIDSESITFFFFNFGMSFSLNQKYINTTRNQKGYFDKIVCVCTKDWIYYCPSWTRIVVLHRGHFMVFADEGN